MQTPFNGDYYDSAGNIRNILENGEQAQPSPKDYMSPRSGDFYASDGSVHNIEELGGGDLSDYAKIAYVDEQTSAKADKSTAIDLTLTTDWEGSAAPYTQTVAVAGMTEAANCIYDVAAGVTAAQLEAYEAARVVVKTQGADSLAFSAFGDKPVAAIPVTVVIVG